MSSAAPTSAECVCTSGGRSAGAAVGNHEDAAGSPSRVSVECMESMESSRATRPKEGGCGSAAACASTRQVRGRLAAFNAPFMGGGGVCSMLQSRRTKNCRPTAGAPINGAHGDLTVASSAENRAASALVFASSRPGAPFASDDYLKCDLDGQIRIAVPVAGRPATRSRWRWNGRPSVRSASRASRSSWRDGEPKMTSFLVEVELSYLLSPGPRSATSCTPQYRDLHRRRRPRTG